MSWSTPKINWGVEAVGTADFNRIEENIRCSRFGRNDLGSNIASGSSLLIVKNYHVITGSTNVKYLSTAAYLPGASVKLLFQSALQIDHDEGSVPANYAAMFLSNVNGTHGDIVVVANTLVDFFYDGTYWRSGLIYSSV